MINYDDYIWGDKFKNLLNCNFIKIDDAKNFLNSTSRVNKIVTHNGDLPVNESYLYLKNKFNFWFGQNIFIDDDKFIPIPIGLENDYVPNSVQKKHMLHDYSNKNINIKKLLYINHNVGTNYAERIIPYNLFQTNNFITIHSCDGFDNQNKYYINIKEHQFTLSPPGNGLDCHRTWEILYLGRIPILKNIHTLKKLYSDLPVVFINKYEDITEEFLLTKRDELQNKSFNYNKLKFSYWKDLIEKK
jgi:hypothetical protein